MGTFKRLLGFLRPYRSGVTWSFVLAFGAMVMTVLIPYLTGLAINSIRGHEKDTLIKLGVAIAIAGVLRLGLSSARRRIAGRVSLGVERGRRNLIYNHCAQHKAW